ncbi:hypothetical protein N8T08_001579 [Aspergillus melleus]|uniref:Uncharacterized protein n=1 Tax=Aspergillus melleus TaxID=138277 RepID=A0ACC3AN90_9EURO|nr:hypothetical protein N8T08_001579 [Aspergillus melleus]
MASGKCTFVGKGDGPFLTTSCGCPAGRFGLDDDNKLTGNCEKCTHSISDHETSRSPAPPVPLAITQVPRLTGPKYCQRTETVTKLLQLSETFPVVHIRGTPATGKSILAELLKDALERQGTSVIFRTKWDPLVSANEHRVAVESAFYEQVAKESLYPGFFPNGVLIVDEAQGTYSDVLFWDVFLKYLSTRELMNNRVRVFLFCCYGSPSTGADRDEAMTPHRLAEEQRVTLTPQSLPGSPQIGLFYDEREFLEVISRIEGEYQECFRLTDDAKSYLRMLTSGHAGCLWSLINCIYNAHRSSMKHHEGFEVTKAHFIQFLKDESSAFEHLLKSDLGRAFYDENISSFTIPAANILYEIAEKGNLPWDPKQDGMQTCYRRGWVQRLALNEKLDPAVKEVVVLPTLLHEM